MPWSRKFPTPITLKHDRVVATLADARALMLDLPERAQLRPFWQFAGKVVLEAAEQRGGILDAWRRCGAR